MTWEDNCAGCCGFDGNDAETEMDQVDSQDSFHCACGGLFFFQIIIDIQWRIITLQVGILIGGESDIGVIIVMFGYALLLELSG